MKPSPPLHLALAIFAAAATRSSAQLAPQLIFRDTFDTSANSLDVNFQNNLGRQSGSAGVLTYAEAPATAPGGAQNAASQINNADSPGHLRLNPNPTAGVVSISPNHNFIEGGQFSIEFDVDAGLNDPDGASSDWAAVVFGASSQNAFVNGSDGMGILFRHNGDIEVWDGATSIYGGSGDFPGGVPKDQIHIRIEVTTGNFLGGSPATIIMFINGEEVRLNPASLEYVKAGGFRANYVTLEGYAAAPGSWVDTFDNFSITAVPCINASSYLVSSAVGQSNQSVTITIPAQLNATSDVDVTVTSSDPAIAGPAGAPIGALTLHYAAGSSTMQSFNVVTRARGTATLAVAGPGGVCLGGDIIVVVGGSFVANPSFEENSQPIFPGYGPIDRWNQIPGGNIGLNDSAGPFHDNGAVPDRNQVAFAQGNGGIWQTIGGLIPGQPYWLQFRYNVRNCCGGTMSLRVLFGGQQLDNIPNIKPVGGAQDYSYRNVVFVPNSSTGRLEFASAAAGDATLLLDAVTIVPRDTNQVLVANPSFAHQEDTPHMP